MLLLCYHSLAASLGTTVKPAPLATDIFLIAKSNCVVFTVILTQLWAFGIVDSSLLYNILSCHYFFRYKFTQILLNNPSCKIFFHQPSSTHFLNIFSYLYDARMCVHTTHTHTFADILYCTFYQLNISICIFLSHVKFKTPKQKTNILLLIVVSQCKLKSSIPLFLWS